MLRSMRARPRRAALAAALLAAALAFIVYAVLEISSTERLRRHPELMSGMETAGREYVSEKLGMEIPGDFKAQFSVDRAGSACVTWRPESGTGNFSVFFEGVKLYGAGEIDFAFATVTMDEPYGEAPYAAALVDRARDMFERMLGREISPPETAELQLTAAEDAWGREKVLLNLIWEQDGEAGASFRAGFSTPAGDLDGWKISSCRITYGDEETGRREYDSGELKAMLAMAEGFVSDSFGTGYGCVDYCVPAGVNELHSGAQVFFCFDGGEDGEDRYLKVGVQDGEVRAWREGSEHSHFDYEQPLPAETLKAG